jgi:hypothetical protein
LFIINFIHTLPLRLNDPQTFQTQTQNGHIILAKQTGRIGIHASIPERHPCQKRNDEIEDDLQDYIELINKLQDPLFYKN